MTTLRNTEHVQLTLNYLKRKPEAKERFAGKNVRIYSGQWKQFWGPDRSGYTSSLPQAGVYTFDDAWAASSHCGPEKKIEYHETSSPVTQEARSLR